MLILSPAHVLNPAALETRRVPRKVFGRIALLPRRAGAGTWARIVLEGQFLRYMVALVPFLVAMAIWPELALPIAQAPILMVLVIGVVEMRVLRLSDSRRAALIDEAGAARGLDLLRFRAHAVLRRIAARRGLEAGRLHLVVEQSELAHLPPLTLVSLQMEGPPAHVLAPDTEEERMLREELFDATFSERDLHRINLREGVFLRDVALEAEGLSAHSRLAAMLEARQGAAAPA
ncbi:MAG: hypothetical protein ACLFRU_04925 [Paracoccaceae bacterium]